MFLLFLFILRSSSLSLSLKLCPYSYSSSPPSSSSSTGSFFSFAFAFSRPLLRLCLKSANGASNLSCCCLLRHHLDLATHNVGRFSPVLVQSNLKENNWIYWSLSILSSLKRERERVDLLPFYSHNGKEKSNRSAFQFSKKLWTCFAVPN